MLNWLKKLFAKNGKNENPCEQCVWWRAEHDFGMPEKKGKHYCNQLDKYTKANMSCEFFKKEKFEADEFSTSTEEMVLDFEVSAEKTGNESDKNDPEARQK